MKIKTSMVNFAVLIFVVIIAVIILADDMMKSLVIILLLMNILSLASQSSQPVLSVSIDEKRPKSKQQPTVAATNSVVMKPAANKLDDNIGKINRVIPVESPQQLAPSSLGSPESLDLYGIYYDKWNNQRSAYTNSYNEPRPRVGTSCAERNYAVDSANTLIWQKRTHDKQRNDGWAAKSADYFAYHYADELDIEERKRWWGNDEF